MKIPHEILFGNMSKSISSNMEYLDIINAYSGNNILIDINLDIEINQDNKNVIKYIKEKIYKAKIINKPSNYNLLVVNVKFNNLDDPLYNVLIDNSNVSIMTRFKYINYGIRTFSSYQISTKSLQEIQKYIKSFGNYNKIWNDLASATDYNYSRFKKRTWPYMTLKSSEWKQAVVTASAADGYPAQLADTKTQSIETKIVTNEQKANFNNNYDKWYIIPASEYIDTSIFVQIIKLLIKINMHPEAIELFFRLCISPYHVHIIKEKDIWNTVLPIINTYNKMDVLQYVMYYNMYIFRHEETIIHTRVHQKYRIIFTLSQAASLPHFNNINILRNPYVQQLTGSTSLKKSMLLKINGYRKINNECEFRRRFNIATGGAFKNIDMKKLGASITGSILIPCVHTSPLEQGFESVEWNTTKTYISQRGCDIENAQDAAFEAYLQYYYPGNASLPVDVYNAKVKYNTDHDCKDAKINASVNDDNVISDDDEVIAPDEVEPDEVAHNEVIAPDEADQDNIKIENSIPKYNELADIDIAIAALCSDSFDAITDQILLKVRENCKYRGMVYKKKIITSTYKWHLYGPGLPRPIEIFRFFGGPEKLTKRFHMCCVKMWYDNDIYMYRECIASLLSGTNEYYNWFSCNKIPADVVLKYTQRGISTILNQKEITAAKLYIKNNERWGPIFDNGNCNIDNLNSITNIYHPFFSPDKYNCGIRLNLKHFNRPINTNEAYLSINKNSNIRTKLKKATRICPPQKHIIAGY